MKPQIHPVIFTIMVVLAMLSADRHAHAQPGSLDPTFAQAGQFIEDFGAQDNLTRIRVRPIDQKIVAVGTALTPAFAGQLLVIRFLPDGTPDPSFGEDGVVTITDFNESYAYDLFFQADGKMVVAGTRADENFQFSMLVTRLNDDGSVDPTFGSSGYSEPEISAGEDIAYAMVPLPNGQFLLAGTARDTEERNRPVVVRMNEDGTVDATFGADGVASLPITGIDNRFWNLGLQSDGSIVATGHMDMGLTVSGQFNFDILVARFTSEGLLDETFGDGGLVVDPISTELVESAMGMALDAADNILLCGYTTNPDFSYDAFLMKLEADGNDLPSFGTDGLVTFNNGVQDVFTGMVLQPDGKILTCGTSGGFFFDPRDQLVARFDVDGALDEAFGTGGITLTNAMGQFDEANAITLQDDAKILLAGKANNGNNNDIAVSRYLNDFDARVTELDQLHTLELFPNPVVSGGRLLVELGETRAGMVSVQLFDALGGEVLIGRGTGAAGAHVIEVPMGLAPGLYTVRIGLSEGRSSTARLVVQ